MIQRRQLPLNALRAFEAVAKHSHMRNAAEELGVTHGAISRQLKRLEELIEMQLFTREHNALQLTAAGERLYRSTSQAFDQLSKGMLQLDPESLRGPLVIASTQSIISSWLVGVVGEFSQQYPEIDIELISVQPLADTLAPDIDVAVCYGRPKDTRLEVSYLFQERYFPVMSPSLLEFDHSVEKPSDLLSFPLISDQIGHWQRWLARYELDIGMARRSLYIQQSFDAVNAAINGFGVAMADRIEVNLAIKEGKLIAPLDMGYDADYCHYLVSGGDTNESVRTRIFSEYLRSAVQKLIS